MGPVGDIQPLVAEVVRILVERAKCGSLGDWKVEDEPYI